VNRLLWLVLALSILACCGQRIQISELARGDEPTQAAAKPEKLDAPHLPNAYRIHEKVISGGLPEGDEAFQQLVDLGIKTIISVDGAKPDLETAKKFGLKYVHLPFGYDGIPNDRAVQLAKAVRDLPGPIYIHCHHGKHRSPAAASVACVGAGLVDSADAETILKTAGTSPDYRGLYASAREARRFERAFLDALQFDFPEISVIPPMADAMVDLERTHDHVRQIEAAGWRSPANHPDLEPAHEALLLRERFTELLRTDMEQQEPEEFQQLLGDSESAAKELEALLKSFDPDAASKAEAERVTRTFARITTSCTACHNKYRNVPLDSK
jgi:protein tyrosine phosphatase (PTP) superfamily phosphohydrolase (DUF442 family)